MRKVLENGGSAYIVVNRSPDKKIKITRAIVHPRYGKPELNFEGKPHAVAAYDVGLLHTDENAPKSSNSNVAGSWRNSIPATVSVI